jgi:hypothetical protein
MPYVIRPKQRKALVSALASGAVLASLVLPAAAAAAACPTTEVSKPFQRFGDNADYSIVSNGHFESGTSDWSLTSASVVSENESFKVRSASDTKSLRIKAKGKAVSPAFCVGIEHPTFRFFARRASGTWGVLNAKLRWTDEYGITYETLVGAPSGGLYIGDPYKSWRASPVLPLASALPLWQNGTSLSVRLVFAADGGGGDWLIDDVYIDPYRR